MAVRAAARRRQQQQQWKEQERRHWRQRHGGSARPERGQGGPAGILLQPQLWGGGGGTVWGPGDPAQGVLRPHHRRRPGFAGRPPIGMMGGVGVGVGVAGVAAVFDPAMHGAPSIPGHMLPLPGAGGLRMQPVGVGVPQFRACLCLLMGALDTATAASAWAQS